MYMYVCMYVYSICIYIYIYIYLATYIDIYYAHLTSAGFEHSLCH